MTVSPPPWGSLTAETVSQRLAALSTSISSAPAVRRCFSRDAVFSTGNETIDRLLPDGGVACGTVLEVFGPPAAGKSHLARQMVATLAVRGCVEWTAMAGAAAAMECELHDWCVFFLLSDLSSLSTRHFYESLKNKLMQALANNVQHSDDVERLVLALQQKVKLVSFTTPNDLLVFFRFLSNVEYALSKHHTNRRRVLVVVDNVARLWEHPSCGVTSHARHWMAAALVREVRNAIVAGNGWRNNLCGGGGKCPQGVHDATPIGQQSTVDAPRGGVAVVFVNGSTNMYSQHSGALPPGPLGGPVWCAAAADLRLFVEPLFGAGVLPPHRNGSGGGCDTQQDGLPENATMRVRLVKGGGDGGSKVVVV